MVTNNLIQNRSRKIQVIGSDVAAEHSRGMESESYKELRAKGVQEGWTAQHSKNPEQFQKDAEKSAKKRSKRKEERLEQANTNTRRD